MGKKLFLIFSILASLFIVSGCIYIPPNEHVGQPAPHSYKDSYYYGDRYYHNYRYY